MVELRDITKLSSIYYLKEQINMSGKTLGRLADLLPFESGRVYAIAPSEIALERLFVFQSGLLNDQKNKTSNEGLVPIVNEGKQFVLTYLNRHINTHSNNWCIFEDSLAQPSDPWLQKSALEFNFIGSEVYYVFTHKNNSTNQMELALTHSEGYYFLCAGGSDSAVFNFPLGQRKEINPEQMHSLAGAISFVIVGAYDHEGYLIWKRKSS